MKCVQIDLWSLPGFTQFCCTSAERIRSDQKASKWLLIAVEISYSNFSSVFEFVLDGLYFCQNSFTKDELYNRVGKGLVELVSCSRHTFMPMILFLIILSVFLFCLFFFPYMEVCTFVSLRTNGK